NWNSRPTFRMKRSNAPANGKITDCGKSESAFLSLQGRRARYWPAGGDDMSRRCALILVLAIAATPLLLAPFAGSAPETPQQELSGKVVPLAEALEKAGAKLDKDAAPYWLALVAEDGKAYPLVKDAGSRMFFKDKQLLNRPVQLT